MPVHDWTRVDAGIFHAFHAHWISAVSDVLNEGILPEDYYALSQLHAAGFDADVFTLQGSRDDENAWTAPDASGGRGGSLAAPHLAPTAETDMEFYRRKQTSVAIRHVSGDRVVAMIEIVSPGNKSTRHAMRLFFVEKAAELLGGGVAFLLVVDLFPPRSPRPARHPPPPSLGRDQPGKKRTPRPPINR